MRQRPICNVRHTNAVLPLCSAIALCSWVATAPAGTQWIVINLHPEGATFSTAFAVHGSQYQAGSAVVEGIAHAGLWTGTAASWVDLHPTAMLSSSGQGVDVNQQVGFTVVDPTPLTSFRAALWSGTAGSWVNLHPASADFSEARDVCGITQVGYVANIITPPFQSQARAAMWTGTAASFVSLHPPGLATSAHSRAFATDCAQQVGFTTQNANARAALWSGTPESWVNLHPAGTGSSIAHGVHNGQQVGEASVDGNPNASLWTGTAASWVNLNPAGATYSYAHGVHNGQQVGHAFIDEAAHASWWNDTAASWVDLHQFLPPEFTTSEARGISHAGPVIYVVGYGFNGEKSHDEALMWIGLPPCAADVNGDGATDVDDLLIVIEDWGDCPTPCPPHCPADIVRNCIVEVNDLLVVIAGWGPCP